VTTLLIDDELGRQVSQAATARGQSVEEFVSGVLRDAVNGVEISRTTRGGLPVMKVIPPTPIDPRVVQRTLQEEGF
jgi:hypothetical protein